MTYRATMTPVEVDTFLAANWHEQAKARASIAGWERFMNPRGREARPADRERAEVAIAELRETLVALRDEALPYEARYALAPWNRYFLVTNGNGHVHRGMDCSTCYATTQYAWLIELADCDEATMVADCGEKACTVCFPDAPSEYARLKAAGLLTRTERLTADEQAAVRAEKDAKAAAKAEKAIFAPDGSTLRLTGQWGQEVRTLVTARRELSRALQNIALYPNSAAEYEANVKLLVAAIAHKTGEDAEALLADAKVKAAKALERERRRYG